MFINLETVKFINDLNQLAKKSQNGIFPFSTFTDWEDKHDYLFYDDKRPKEIEPNLFSYPLISDCVIDNLHHDIVSTWTEDYNGRSIINLEFVVQIDEEEKTPYVVVRPKQVEEDMEFYIIIEDGQWYCV